MEDTQIVKAFMATVGMAPRNADIAVVQMMGRGQTYDERVGVLAEYIWDHWMGEPEEPTLEQVVEKVKEVVK